MTTVLAIDQGTSSTKAVVVDGDGNVRGSSRHPVDLTRLSDGGVEQDPQELLDSVIGAGRAATSTAGIPIDVVALANQGETVLAWDPDNGTPLSNMIVWQDRRAEGICAKLAEHADLFARRTGLELSSYFSAPKMAWLRRNVTCDGVVTTSDSWLIHRLTGEFVTDVTTASRSLVTDLDTASWDPELLNLFGLKNERLPAIVPCDEVVGRTTMFGNGNLAVGGLVVDQQAALVGDACLRTGEAKCTFGTGAFLLGNTGTTATRSAAGLDASVAWRLRDTTTYCVDGQVFAAGSALDWLKQLGVITADSEIDSVAAPDAGGVLAVPALAGLGAPWSRPKARPSVIGKTSSTTVGQLVTAILQGIAAQVAAVGSAAERDLGKPLTRLPVDGGLTRCATLMQSVADLMQIEIAVNPGEATALGAAALARMAHDPSLSLADAVVAWQPSGVYTPGWSVEQAAEFRARWNAAADRA